MAGGCLAAPVAVAANTTYVISYHTNTGHYASNQGYFASATSKSPLRALANGEDGSNGVYRYGASAFPSQTWSSSNYWVDVVFKTAAATQAAPAGAGTSAGTLAAAAPAASATATTSVSGSGTTTTAAAAPATATALPAGSTPVGTSSAEVPNASAGVQAAKQPPAAPVPVAPANDEIVTAQPALKTGSFQHPNAGESHAETRWQVFRDDDSTCVLDIQTSDCLTSLTVPKLVLEMGTAYFWRAQFIDSDGDVSERSDYGYFSTETTTADLNANGIPDLQEVGRTADLDKDGVRDSRQSDIKSVKVPGTGAQIGVSIKGCPTALAVEAVESEDPQQSGPVASGKPGSMPFGLINFRIAVAAPGDPAVVKLYFSQAAPASSKWYKYDPIAGSWYDFSAYAKFAADRFSVTLTLRTGDPGMPTGSPMALSSTRRGSWPCRTKSLTVRKAPATPASQAVAAGLAARGEWRISRNRHRQRGDRNPAAFSNIRLLDADAPNASGKVQGFMPGAEEGMMQMVAELKMLLLEILESAFQNGDVHATQQLGVNMSNAVKREGVVIIQNQNVEVLARIMPSMVKTLKLCDAMESSWRSQGRSRLTRNSRSCHCLRTKLTRTRSRRAAHGCMITISSGRTCRT